MHSPTEVLTSFFDRMGPAALRPQVVDQDLPPGLGWDDHRVTAAIPALGEDINRSQIASQTRFSEDSITQHAFHMRVLADENIFSLGRTSLLTEIRKFESCRWSSPSPLFSTFLRKLHQYASGQADLYNVTWLLPRVLSTGGVRFYLSSPFH